MKRILVSFLFSFSIILMGMRAQTVSISVNASSGRAPISPYIYGKNNCLSDNPSNSLSASEWQFLRDAGVTFFRENGGNNATKYNWRLKLTSHPDWYNNVYSHDWDYEAQSLQGNLPEAMGMWAFQLIGKSASNTGHNFNDWEYNNSQWWSGVSQNLAGGGVVNPSGGSDALVDGDPDLYLINWPTDSTVGILDRWFGSGGLGLKSQTICYWSMDNEPEIWFGTHDDIMPVQISAEAFMQRFFEVAKKARAKFPDIKIVGPVIANEWQWYSWNNSSIPYQEHNYCWLEYFILRIAEEQQESGIRLLDVLDLHFYPYEDDPADIVQLYRVFFDRTYDYPGANGVKCVNGGWDNSITKEYIFERCSDWLDEYLGSEHGVTFSVSEMGIQDAEPNVTAIWYASILGTFANEGVKIFTPWHWNTGMWEVLHLFSRYNQDIKINSQSDLEEYVSAYSSLSSGFDSLTIILVNRSLNTTYSSEVDLSNFTIADGSYSVLTLSDLPSNETFESHTENALVTQAVTVNTGSFTISMSPLSISAVILSGAALGIDNPIAFRAIDLHIYLDFSGNAIISYDLPESSMVQIELFDIQGRKVALLEDAEEQAGKNQINYNTSRLTPGIYMVRLKVGNLSATGKFVHMNY